MNANSSKTGYMKSYDASDVTSVVDGNLLFGYQSGDFITWEWDNDKSSVDGDSMGTFVISKNNKNSGSITYNLSQQSPCNKVFTDLCNANKEFAVDIQSDTEHVYGANAIVARIPSGQDGDGSQARSWQIKVLNLEYERKDTMPS